MSFARPASRSSAISADPPQRSTMLARFLHTDLPLLSDSAENLLGRLGLVQHYRTISPTARFRLSSWSTDTAA